MKSPQILKPRWHTGPLAALAAALTLAACTPSLPPLAPLPVEHPTAVTAANKALAAPARPTPPLPQGMLLDKVVAVVNGSPILLSQVRDEENLLFAEIKARGFQRPPRKAFRRQVLARLIRERIEIDEAKHHGIEASPNQVSAIMASIAARNHIPFTQFPAWLEHQGISYQAYRRQIAHALTVHRLLEAAVGPTVTVSKSEIAAYLRRHRLRGVEEDNLSEIVLPVTADRPSALIKTQKEARSLVAALRHGASFSAMAVAHSIAGNSLRGGAMGWIPLRDLPRPARPVVAALRPHEISNPVATGEGYIIYKLHGRRRQELGHVYATEWKLERIVLTPTPVRGTKKILATLKRLRLQVLHGAHWSALARALSVDPAVAINGGHMGWVRAGQLSPPYRTVLKHLRVGQVSAPFATRSGWAIIRLLGKRRRNVTHQTLVQEAYGKIFTRKFDAASRAYENRLFDESIVHDLVSWAS